MVLGTKLEGKLLDLLAVAKVSATMFAFSLSSVTTPLSEVRFGKGFARKFPDRDLATLHIFFVLARVVKRCTKFFPATPLSLYYDAAAFRPKSFIFNDMSNIK